MVCLVYFSLLSCNKINTCFKRERGRNRQRQRDTDRQTERDRNREREREGDRDRETETQREREVSRSWFTREKFPILGLCSTLLTVNANADWWAWAGGHETVLHLPV